MANPPNDQDLEFAVLGACLFDTEEAVSTILEYGGEKLFYGPKHIVLWNAIKAIYESGSRPDQLTITEELRKQGKLELVGGEATIASFAGEVWTGANTRNHCKILQEKAILRTARAVCVSIAGMCEAPQASAEGVIASFSENLAKLKEEFGAAPKNLSDRIREWIDGTDREFAQSEMDRDLGITAERDKFTRRKTIQRLVKNQVIVKSGSKHGVYRKVDDDCKPMDWKSADDTVLPIQLPLDIHKYVEIMPKNIIVIAGEQNAGKTCFLLNVARMNMETFDIHYFSSEMGPAELKKRLAKFERSFDLKREDWRLNFYERSSNFADLIRPDAINIIDFMEIHDDFWKAGQYIKDIFDRLDKGIAVIALQKDPEKDFGRGGSITNEKPRLYLSLKHGSCKIIKAKNWRTTTNPNGMTCKFKLINGSRYQYDDWIMPSGS